jgi:2-polyprenyl-3-methyl-5-hydroxy-6-metoxy-1,4-benzoquinol methylase
MAPKTVSAFFDEYATGFDAIYGTRHTALNRFVNTHFRKSMRLRFEKSIAGCSPIEGRSVVDIGCGPGHYAIALARRGAAHVFGLDFAEGMLDVARRHAGQAGVADRCQWAFGDFLAYPFTRTYDYAIVMGFMDYIAEPVGVVRKVVSITTGRAFFSFPLAGGLLAWQRQWRYRRRCDLFLYTAEQVRGLFAEATDKPVTIEPIARDLFVTVHCGSAS